jgi:hypothetical protein
MRSKMQKWMVMLFGAVLAASGCSNSGSDGGEGEAETCAGGAQVCAVVTDCGQGSICDKEDDGDAIPAIDDTAGCCVRVACLSNADCEAGRICDLRRGVCVPENLCDAPGEAGCTNGDVCTYVDGEPACESAPTPTACDFDVSTYYVSAGNNVELDASGKNANGALVPHTSFTYTASAGTMAGSVLTVPANQTTDITVTAQPGGCTADVRVYATLPANEARIVLIDAKTRLPISGATVAIGNGTLTTGTTDADGVFSAAITGTIESLSAFPTGHQWQTVIAPASRDVIFFTAQTPPANPSVDGVTGTVDFSKVNTRGEIRAALVGPAIGKDITDLNFGALLGEPVATRIDIDGILEDTDVNLPEGLVFGLSNQTFKETYAAQTDRAGPAAIWGLAGKVELNKISAIVQSATSADSADPGAILGAILPFFGRFDHAVVTDISFDNLAPRAAGSAPPSTFDTRILVPQQQLYFTAGFDFPPLPCAPLAYTGGANRCGGQLVSYVDEDDEDFVVPAADCPAGVTCNAISSYATGVIVLSAVVVPNRGIIPLGISAGLDDNDDEDTDSFNGVIGQNGEDNGSLSLDFAPPHSGLEGNKYATVAIAIDLNGIDLGGTSFGASIMNRVSDTLSATGNSFEVGAFMESQGGSLTGTGFSLDAKGDADFYRVNYDNGNGADWNVWFEGAATSFEVADLAPPSVNAASRTTTADIQAFKLGAGYSGLTADSFDDLFAFNGTNLDNLSLYVGSWSTQQCVADALCTGP